MKTLAVSFFAVLFASVALRAEERVIVQKDKRFSVSQVDLKLGDTLVFTNGETTIEHNLFSITPGNEFDLGVQKAGKTDRLVLDPKTHREGLMTVQCAIHRGMKLKVNIKAAN